MSHHRDVWCQPVVAAGETYRIELPVFPDVNEGHMASVRGRRGSGSAFDEAGGDYYCSEGKSTFELITEIHSELASRLAYQRRNYNTQ